MGPLGVIIAMMVVWLLYDPKRSSSWLGYVIGNAVNEYRKIVKR